MRKQEKGGYVRNRHMKLRKIYKLMAPGNQIHFTFPTHVLKLEIVRRAQVNVKIDGEEKSAWAWFSRSFHYAAVALHVKRVDTHTNGESFDEEALVEVRFSTLFNSNPAKESSAFFSHVLFYGAVSMKNPALATHVEVVRGAVAPAQ